MYDLNYMAGRIKKARNDVGLTQGQLAQKLYCERETVTAWESGKNIPKIDTLIQLCDILQCDLGHLLGEYPEKRREISDACKITGLSERAINYILCETTPPLGLPIFENKMDLLFVLNTLLTSTTFWKIVHLLGGYVNAPKQEISRAAEIYREYHLSNYGADTNDTLMVKDVLAYKMQRAFNALLDEMDNYESEADNNGKY